MDGVRTDCAEGAAGGIGGRGIAGLSSCVVGLGDEVRWLAWVA